MTIFRLTLLSTLALTGCRACQDDPGEDSGANGTDTEDTADTADTADTDDSGDTADTDDSGDTASEPVDVDEDGFMSDEDCDDSDPEINPDATEICNDGIDQDCDPESSGCDMSLGNADAVLLGESASHYAGVSVDSAGDVNGDGYADLLVGAKQFDSEGLIEGAAYLVYGPIDDKGGNLNELGLRLEGTMESSNAGVQVVGLSDLDGDGMDEVLVSATTVGTDGLNKNGEIYFFRGSSLAGQTAGGSLSLAEADASFTGTSGFQWLGGAFADLGDVDGDDIPDLYIGSTGKGTRVTSGGVTYLVTGQTLLDSSGTSQIDDVFTSAVHGIDERGYLGSRLAGPGDMNGDGLADMVIGAPLLNDAGSESGTVFINAGPTSGEFDVDGSSAALVGAGAGDQLGSSVSPAGDVDGDGYADLWIGAESSDEGVANGGAAYLIYGAADWAALTGTGAELAATAVYGMETDAGIGGAIAGDGDFNGDGVFDLLVGQSEAGSSGEGAAWLFLGPFEGTTNTDDARARLDGDEPGDHVATSVDFSPSLSGGDTDWLVIGAWQDDENGSDAGAIFLMSSLDE